MRLFVLALVACVIFAIAGCSTSTPVPPTPNVNAPTVLLPLTPSAQNADLPTLLPTVVVTANPATPTVQVIVVTATPSPTLTTTGTPAVVVRAPTRVVPTATPGDTVTPFPVDTPKVYVTGLSVNPTTPKPNAAGVFSVSFQNASGTDQSYNWCVEIWQADNVKKPFGLTTCQSSPMPVGATNLTATGWLVKGLGECTAYRARVVARDEQDNRTNFIQPDGNILWLDFSVCP